MRDGTDTRLRIERAALELFVEKGVTATTIRDIAHAARVAEGALYRHYASKDDLVWGLFSTHYTALAATLDALQRDARGGKAKIAAMLEGCCRLFESDRTLFTFLLLVQHGQLGKVTAEMTTPVNLFRDVVAAAMQKGEFAPGDPEAVTALLLGLLLQSATFIIYGRIRQPLDALAPRIVAAAMAVIDVGRD
jgi:AcrR family transcriptional regulator